MNALQVSTVALPRRDEPPAVDAPRGHAWDQLVAATRDDAVRAALLAAGAPAAVVDGPLAAWSAPTSWQVRTLLLVHEAGALVAAGLEVHRPLARYARLAHWWTGRSGPAARAAADALVTAVAALAREDRAAALTLQVAPDDDVLWAAGLAAGLDPVAAPASGAPLPHDPAALPRGLRRWLRPVADRPVPYMRQTTEYTCGPVAASMALAAAGLVAAPNRRDELQLWREATYMPGCDPFGLAVALSARGARPEVWTSSTDAGLLEDALDPGTRDMREFVQADFRAQAAAAGVGVEQTWAGVAAVEAAVRAGSAVLLLVDQHPMHLEPCPHWVVAHGTWGDEADGGLVVDDPWTDTDLGETWLDATGLPLPRAAVDRLWSWGDPPWRAAIVLP